MKTRLPAVTLALAVFAVSAFAQSIADPNSFTAPPSCSQAAPPNSPVANHGRLRVQGNRIVDRNNQPVQLRGMSLYWSMGPAGASSFYTAATVVALRNEWQATVIRPAMGIERDFWDGDQRGFIANPDLNWERVRNVIDGACQAGIYVIIDWHSYAAEATTEHAISFFTRMANLFRNVPNVIYEIYNEPNGRRLDQSGNLPRSTPSGIPVNDVGWTGVAPGMPGGRSVKDHMQQVTNAIRAVDTNNLILIGTPNWCQLPNVATADPIAGSNLVYTAHFYSGDTRPIHRGDLRNNIMIALNRGFPIFISEFGLTTADGQTLPADWETHIDVWFDFLNEHYIGWANWSLSSLNEHSAALNGSSLSNRTTSGTKIYNSLRANPNRTPNRFFYLTTSVVCQGGDPDENCGGITVTGAGLVVERTAANRNAAVTAATASGWRFVGWSGAATSTNPGETILLDANKTITATFERHVLPTVYYCAPECAAQLGAVPDGCFATTTDCRESMRQTWFCPDETNCRSVRRDSTERPADCPLELAACMLACAANDECDPGEVSVRHNRPLPRTTWQLSRISGGGFTLSGPTSATVSIYDLRGRIVRTIAYDAGRQVSLGNLGLSRGNYVISVRDYISGAEVYRGRVSLVR